MRTTGISDSTALLNSLNAYPPKYALISRILLETGFRVSDVLNLKKRDVVHLEREKRQITERKTQKKRELKLSDKLREDLLEYASREKLRTTDFMFPSTRLNRSKHISRHQVFRVMKKAARDAGLEGVISPHSCRKTYARKKFVEHGDIFELQKDMRHTYVSTTLGYLIDSPPKRADGEPASNVHPIFADILKGFGIVGGE